MRPARGAPDPSEVGSDRGRCAATAGHETVSRQAAEVAEREHRRLDLQPDYTTGRLLQAEVWAAKFGTPEYPTYVRDLRKRLQVSRPWGPWVA